MKLQLTKVVRIDTRHKRLRSDVWTKMRLNRLKNKLLIFNHNRVISFPCIITGDPDFGIKKSNFSIVEKLINDSKIKQN